jgi:hypothetical protein
MRLVIVIFLTMLVALGLSFQIIFPQCDLNVSVGVYKIMLKNPLSENMSVYLNGSPVPFWVENENTIWAKFDDGGCVRIKRDENAFQNPQNVFLFFDDFKAFDREKWVIINEKPTALKSEIAGGRKELMPQKFSCLDVKISNGVLNLKSSKNSVRCRLYSKSTLGKTVTLRFRAWGGFEIGFKSKTGIEISLASQPTEKKWNIVEKLAGPKGKTIFSKNIDPYNGWMTLSFENGKVFLNGILVLEDEKFIPGSIFISAHMPGEVEVDYVYSLDEYREVRIEK